MLTKRQKQTLDFIRSYSQKKGYAPSLEEIGSHLGLSSVSTAHHHVRALRELGYLQKENHQPRAINVYEQGQMVCIPLSGTIAAGLPIEAVEEKETITIPKSVALGKGELFALRVVGDSMIDENIGDGDVVVVKKQPTAKNGERVVALLDNSEATLKSFFKEGERIRLQPANKKFDPIILSKGDIAIQGVVIDVIKNSPGINEPEPRKKVVCEEECLAVNNNYCGDARDLLPKIQKDSVALSVWSPPYYVGKEYEKDYSYESWLQMLRDVIRLHFSIVKPGGFLVVNIADILCFKDSRMPRFQAETFSRQKFAISKEDILKVLKESPTLNRYELAKKFNCSEQTIDRRLNGNNIRGGKYNDQTKVKLAGGKIEEFGSDAGFYLYDRRIWLKDPAWMNSKWHSLSYRAVDEFEYLYIFWKPGITKVSRDRLSKNEWSEWGSRGVWDIRSVRKNQIHEAMFPIELPRRIIKLLSEKNDVVLDCFMGSGQTAIASLLEKRKFIGIDRDRKYVNLANERVTNYLKQPALFE